MTAQELIEFEQQIAELFNAAKIRAPIHLYANNEENIIRVFEKVDINKDWVCCTWRNHYQALLKGIPPELLKDKIIQGKSMVMNLQNINLYVPVLLVGYPVLQQE
jgi:TPP-dependent pyruvate/acetoin dehydrogenase alpha subunit